jgi:hypothetical protein
MKSTAITLILGIALTLGTALTSRAAEQTVDIPQGRGNFVALKAPVPDSVVSKGVRRAPKTPAVHVPGVMRAVTVNNPRGSIVVLREVPL